MKTFATILVSLTFTIMTFNSFQATAYAAQSSGEFQEREEINRSFTLSPDALVKVFSISGPVEIRTTEGSTAEVHVVRTARNREDFARRKFIVEQTATGLLVGTDEQRERSYRNVQIRDHVVLELPRQIQLTLSSISGSVSSGDIAGPVQASSISGSLTLGDVAKPVQVSSVSGALTIRNVRDAVNLNSISGPVQVASVAGHLHASSVSGKLSASMARMDERGIQLTSISGPVELRFQDQLNAEFEATNISGKVSIDVPNAVFRQSENSSNVRARIGSGGSPISLSSVSGSVRLWQ